MPCALTQSYLLDCRDSYGGVKDIYIMEFDNATAITETAGVVTAITKVSTKVFRKYALIAHTAEGSDALTASREMGTISNKQTVSFPINKMTTAVRNEILLLAKNRLLIVCTDENGTAWLYGKGYGLTLASANAKTGKALADRNGYELSFEGEEKELCVALDAATLTSLTV